MRRRRRASSRMTTKELIEQASDELDAYRALGFSFPGNYPAHAFSNEFIDFVQFILSYVFLVCKEEGLCLDSVETWPCDDGSLELEFVIGARSITYDFPHTEQCMSCDDGILVNVYKALTKCEYPVYLNRKVIDQDMLELSGAAKLCADCNKYYSAVRPCLCDSLKPREAGVSRAAKAVRVTGNKNF